MLVGRPLAGAKPAPATAARRNQIERFRRSSAPLIVVVEPQHSRESAKQLVAAAIRVAKFSELDPGKAAIIVVNTAGDPFIAQRELRDQRRTQGRGDHARSRRCGSRPTSRPVKNS